MRKMRRMELLGIITTLLLVSVGISPEPSLGENNDMELPYPVTDEIIEGGMEVENYTGNLSISIFSETNGKAYTGAGTIEEPYLIKAKTFLLDESGDGIYFLYTDVHFHIEDCLIISYGQDSGSTAISLYYSSNITLENCTILSTMHSLEIHSSTNITIGNCSFQKENEVISIGQGIAVRLSDSENIKIIGSGISGFSSGFFFSNSRNISIIDNLVEDCGNGIYFYSSIDIQILQNNFTGTYNSPIRAWDGAWIEVSGNHFSSSNGLVFSGLYRSKVISNEIHSYDTPSEFIITFDTLIRDNLFIGMGMNIENYLPVDPEITEYIEQIYDLDDLISSSPIVEDNMVNGKDILFLDGEEDLQPIIGKDIGHVIVHNCSGIELKDFEMDGNGYLVTITSSDNVSLSGAILNSRFQSLKCSYSDDIIITDCSISSFGSVSIIDCERIDISWNEISTTDDGLDIHSTSRCILKGNKITSDLHGIFILRSPGIHVISNDDHSSMGMLIRYSDDALIRDNVISQGELNLDISEIIQLSMPEPQENIIGGSMTTYLFNRYDQNITLYPDAERIVAINLTNCSFSQWENIDGIKVEMGQSREVHFTGIDLEKIPLSFKIVNSHSISFNECRFENITSDKVISISRCADVTIMDCTFEKVDTGVAFTLSSGCRITGSRFIDNRIDPIQVISSSDMLSIDNNIISGSGRHGILIDTRNDYYSNWYTGLIFNNTIFGSVDLAILVSSDHDLIIFNNAFILNNGSNDTFDPAHLQIDTGNWSKKTRLRSSDSGNYFHDSNDPSIGFVYQYGEIDRSMWGYYQYDTAPKGAPVLEGYEDLWLSDGEVQKEYVIQSFTGIFVLIITLMIIRKSMIVRRMDHKQGIYKVKRKTSFKPWPKELKVPQK